MKSVACALVLVLALLCTASAHAAPAYTLDRVPNPQTTHAGFVSDPGSVLGALGPELEARLSALQRETSAQVAVVILPSIGAEPPRDFATRLFERWKVGRAGHDDGVLVLHVLDQRRVEIETGYGLEGALPDAKCAWLIQEAALPLFRAGELARGQLALVAGIDHAIRHPEAKHAQLLQAALNAAEGVAVPASGAAVSAAKTTDEPSFMRKLLRLADTPLWLALAFALLAGPLRAHAHRRLYREPRRRPGEPWAGFVLGTALGLALWVSAAIYGHGELRWLSTAAFSLTAVLLAYGAYARWQRARARYAARRCTQCGATMRLLSDAKDDAHLDPGQRVEERVRSYDYDVWLCTCGEKHIEQHADIGRAERCEACGRQTDVLKRSKEVQPATYTQEGLLERHYHCAHCKAQHVTRVQLARLVRESSSSTHGSSSSSGSSFGGGRSGGGGAGGSY